MKPLLWFIDFRVRMRPALRLTATCAMPENPAGRADAEFYCLFQKRAQIQHAYQAKKSLGATA
ncbi:MULTISPECIES: hypothetical protein [Paraburkholderia]|uniref:hypothetical protein n=1 Tax=Paraburkholderia TaxID=1822464 RepID=UPI001C376E49|nr:hypothetical protein [Paraburkholderia youngii]